MKSDNKTDDKTDNKTEVDKKDQPKEKLDMAVLGQPVQQPKAEMNDVDMAKALVGRARDMLRKLERQQPTDDAEKVRQDAIVLINAAHILDPNAVTPD